jgi:hypothetical protein
MLNAGLVNALISYFTPPSFCETFPVFGRIVRFQNPFKYTRNFRINHRAAWRPASITHNNQWLEPSDERLTN